MIPLLSRPPYYISESYNPFGNNFYEWNLFKTHIPDYRLWIYDKLEYHALSELRNSARKDEIIALIKAIRNYDKTCIGIDVYDTIITHLYVCELLVKLILTFFDKPTGKTHGYRSISPRPPKFLDWQCRGGKGGTAQNLHSIFYTDTNLTNSTLPSLREYFRYCFEVERDLKELLQTFPLIHECNSDYSATGVHSDPSKTYHLCNPSIPSYIPDFGNILSYYPDHAQYNVSSSYTSFAIEDTPMADNFISVTHDINGTPYSLAFGNNVVPKQRDIEIRYYIIFVLGTAARYNPMTWENENKNDQKAFFLIKQFLQTNHILFPMLALRYITGRLYSIGLGIH